MSLPALAVGADTRSITERVNVLIRDYNRTPQRLVPAGTVLPFAGATVPDGFLFCDGAAVSRATYGDLFAAIGTTHGPGDGSTTFNVPDLRGRAVAGRDNMGGTDAGRLNGGVANRMVLGGTGGAATHTLGTTEMPAHSHGVNDPSHAHSYTAGQIPSAFTPRGTNGDGTNLNNNPATNAAVTGITIQNNGGGLAHNNTQPTIVLNYVICT